MQELMGASCATAIDEKLLKDITNDADREALKKAKK